MGRPTKTEWTRRGPAASLRTELERQIVAGQCAYCRKRAGPGGPLTREHVIPRARGGRRNDVRIIVAACLRCNHERGCRDLIQFLMSRPHRISCVLDYLTVLSSESLREVDLRVFAELFSAVSLLREIAGDGMNHSERRRLLSGRALYRRRYAARRAVHLVAVRVRAMMDRSPLEQGPSCLVPWKDPINVPIFLEESISRMEARLLGLLALSWDAPSELIDREIARAVRGTAMDQVGGESLQDLWDSAGGTHLDLDAGAVRGQAPRRRRRTRIDRRNGRGARPGNGPPTGRRAA